MVNSLVPRSHPVRISLPVAILKEIRTGFGLELRLSSEHLIPYIMQTHLMGDKGCDQ